MKTILFLLFFSIIFLRTTISSAQENDSIKIAEDTTLTISDSLSAKWFKKHELSYAKTVSNKYFLDYAHSFDYRYNLSRNAIRVTASFYKFNYYRYLDVFEQLTPYVWKRNYDKHFQVHTNNIMAGYEFRNRFMNRFCFFYGLQGGYQWSDFDILSAFELITRNQQGYIISKESDYENLKVKEKAINVSPFVGLRLEIIRNLAIGTEMLIDINFSEIDGEKVTTRSNIKKYEKVNGYSVWFNNPGLPKGRFFVMLKF